MKPVRGNRYDQTKPQEGGLQTFLPGSTGAAYLRVWLAFCFVLSLASSKRDYGIYQVDYMALS